MGEVLLGSDRPFVVTSGTAIAANVDGKPSTEDEPDRFVEPSRGFGNGGEGVDGARREHLHRAAVADSRHPQAGPGALRSRRGAQKRVSAYIGDGSNRWPAAHVSDVARLYRLAFEKAEPGAIYHAVDEEGVSMKAIAEALGRGLKVPVVSIKPEEAEAHFGWLARFAGDMPSSSALTQQKLNWKPTGPG